MRLLFCKVIKQLAPFVSICTPVRVFGQISTTGEECSPLVQQTMTEHILLQLQAASKPVQKKKKKHFTYRCGCTQIQGRNMSQLNALRQIEHPFQHKTITTTHKKITEKFRTNTGNSMKLSAVTGSPIYLLSLYLFSRTSTITRTLKTVSTLRLLSCIFG